MGKERGPETTSSKMSANGHAPSPAPQQKKGFFRRLSLASGGTNSTAQVQPSNKLVNQNREKETQVQGQAYEQLDTRSAQSGYKATGDMKRTKSKDRGFWSRSTKSEFHLVYAMKNTEKKIRRCNSHPTSCEPILQTASSTPSRLIIRPSNSFHTTRFVPWAISEFPNRKPPSPATAAAIIQATAPFRWLQPGGALSPNKTVPSTPNPSASSSVPSDTASAAATADVQTASSIQTFPHAQPDSCACSSDVGFVAFPSFEYYHISCAESGSSRIGSSKVALRISTRWASPRCFWRACVRAGSWTTSEW